MMMMIIIIIIIIYLTANGLSPGVLCVWIHTVLNNWFYIRGEECLLRGTQRNLKYKSGCWYSVKYLTFTMNDESTCYLVIIVKCKTRYKGC
jgi:hypothetical protein